MTEYSKQDGRRASIVRQLAAMTLLTERTVYRWMREPERGHYGNRARLVAAARKLGIPLPGASA